MRRVALAVLLALTALVPAPALALRQAAAPPLLNARLEARAGTDLAAVVRALPSGPADVTWIGYQVPAVGRDRRCCWNTAADAGSCCGGCRLEREAVPVAPPGVSASAVGNTPRTSSAVSPGAVAVPLEPETSVVVMVRVAGGAVDRVRTFSPGCVLDAGGRAVVWLPDVAADASAGWLHAQMTADRRRLTDDVLMALAAHASPGALEFLLVDARSGSTSHLRGQALFWLAQRAGDRAVGAISTAIDQDPDTEVKRKAVFALSQLPDGEGVPRLIDVARAHSNLAVRKQAFFWLGQSKDPRALTFFADVLKR